MDEKTKMYTDKARGWVGKAKRMSDGAVKKYGEKLPDSVSNAYDKASATAGKYLSDDEEPTSDPPDADDSAPTA